MVIIHWCHGVILGRDQCCHVYMSESFMEFDICVVNNTYFYIWNFSLFSIEKFKLSINSLVNWWALFQNLLWSLAYLFSTTNISSFLAKFHFIFISFIISLLVFTISFYFNVSWIHSYNIFSKYHGYILIPTGAERVGDLGGAEEEAVRSRAWEARPREWRTREAETPGWTQGYPKEGRQREARTDQEYHHWSQGFRGSQWWC